MHHQIYCRADSLVAEHSASKPVVLRSSPPTDKTFYLVVRTRLSLSQFEVEYIWLLHKHLNNITTNIAEEINEINDL